MEANEVRARYRKSESPAPHVGVQRLASITADVDFTDATLAGKGTNAKAFMIVAGTGNFVFQTPLQTSDVTIANAQDLLRVYMPVELTKIDATTDDSLVVMVFY